MEQYGLYQVTIPLPFRLNHVHGYLAQEENGWTVIDPGLNREETRTAWKEAFSAHGIIPERDIHRIIVTHYHPDHFGFAGAMQQWTGADVYMSEIAQQIGLSTWTEERFTCNRTFFAQAGMPGELRQQLAENDSAFYHLVRPLPQQMKPLVDGHTYRIGSLDYEAIHTPGHAEGHICFYNQTEQVLIAGDHILRKITPNISYHGYGDPNPLATYLHSLEQMNRRDIRVALPGHGPIFTDVKERIEEIVHHHEERLAFMLERMSGAMSAYDVSCALFDRELSVHEQRFAIGETIAHLRYLEETGIITVYDEQGVNMYQKVR